MAGSGISSLCFTITFLKINFVGARQIRITVVKTSKECCHVWMYLREVTPCGISRPLWIFFSNLRILVWLLFCQNGVPSWLCDTQPHKSSCLLKGIISGIIIIIIINNNNNQWNNQRNNQWTIVTEGQTDVINHWQSAVTEI